MEMIRAAQAFATFGHPGRLAVFRLLLRFAPGGVRPTEIAAALSLKHNTLSHHLADLTAAGLVQVTRRGRSLFYACDMAAAQGLIAYLALDVGRARPDLLPPVPSRRDTGFNVLFLCTGNSARSIMAEALLRDLSGTGVNVYSAGTRPAVRPHPVALAMLQRNGHDTSTLRTKDLTEFRRPGSPVMDAVITLCDTAASEDCPPWPGQPVTGHWGLPDPVKATEGETAEAFARTYDTLHRRIAAFSRAPLASLGRVALQQRIDAIGAEPPAL